MARHKHSEETENHEAWVIPYADLMTLLLALFVVMYAISSVNEGKYRVLADAMTTAFGGNPRTINPVQVGNAPLQTSEMANLAPLRSAAQSTTAPDTSLLPSRSLKPSLPSTPRHPIPHTRAQQQMDAMVNELGRTLAPLIDRKLITVRRSELGIEIEINSDILFTPGSATLDSTARATLSRLAEVLRPTPNDVRVEGHTDNNPISTLQFPSNWELSAARAASVVHLFADQGIAPQRLSMIGYGEFRVRADNSTEAGRNANRRVVLIIQTDTGIAAATTAQAPTNAGDASKATDTHGVSPNAATAGNGTQPASAVTAGVN